MASGRFIPFAQYNHDLTRSMSGLCQVFPSRHVALTIAANTWQSIIDEGDAESDKVRLPATGVSDIDYGAVRNSLYKVIFSHARYNNGSELVEYTNNLPDDVLNLETMPAMGEINFISHEVQGGWMYNDIYVHIPTNEIKSTIRLQETALASRPDKTGFEFNVETGQYSTYGTNRSQFTFNAVVLYYNLHMIDPQSKTADTKPVVIDMPMGIYFLDEPHTIQYSNSNIFNQGTSWSTRIVSRIKTGSTTETAPTDRNLEYGTLARVLSEFGDVADTMKQILHRRNVINAQNVSAQDPNSINLSPEDIKAFLEEFRQKHAVNVPYIKDNCWFVNGRNLGPAIGEFDLNAVIKEWFKNMSPEDRELLRGEPGADGADGQKGDKGDTGATGPAGQNGKNGENGHSPIVTVVPYNDNYYISVDNKRQPYPLKGPKGDSGQKGDKGDTPLIDVSSDGYLMVDGNKTGTCLIGPPGEDGNDGKGGAPGVNGKDGTTPNITVTASVSNTTGTPSVTVLKTGTKENANFRFSFSGIKGEKGDSGNSAQLPTFYGYTNLAVNSNGTLFSPTSASASTVGIKPKGEPALQLSKMIADINHQFIWKYASSGWILDNWYYVAPETVIQSSLSNTIVEASLSYGCIKIVTDAIWAVFTTNAGGSNWSFDTNIPDDINHPIHSAQGIVCKPPKICNTEYAMIDNIYKFVISLERWDQSTKTLKLTTSAALDQIFAAIKNVTGKFNWKTLMTYFNGSLPSLPVVIQFANGIFTIQDSHKCKYDPDGNLTELDLFGSLTIWNGGQSYLQGSHGNTSKYAVDMPLYLNLKQSGSSTGSGSASNPQPLIRKLPQSA